MNVERLAAALVFWYGAMGLETPALEEVRFSREHRKKPPCAVATYRRLSGELDVRLIVQFDPTACGGFPESYVARHEGCHHRLAHHLVKPPNLTHEHDGFHGKDFKQCMDWYAPTAARIRDYWNKLDKSKKKVWLRRR